MVNGRYDCVYPVDLSPMPMFLALRTFEKGKRHALFESGHIAPKNLVIKEVLNWFEGYLGPLT